jgi:hypothetical protein
VTRVVTPQRTTGPAAARRPGLAGLIQRKCACGGSTSSLGAACEDCRMKHLGVQPKLALGDAGDHHEREADRVADEVVRGVGARLTRPSLGRVQAHASAAGLTAGEVPPAVESVLSGPGQALPRETREVMEGRFRRVFGDVRVHAGAEASASARAIGARAYTHGRHVVFAEGEYRPDTHAGWRLLAHELAHVVQQGGEGGASVQRDLAIEPQGVDQTLRTLSEEDIKAAITFNKTQIRKADTLREIRDVLGISPEPAESDRDLALAVGRWQAAHGVAQDGRLGAVTVMLLVEEYQAEADLAPGMGPAAEALKAEFAKGTFLDIDASFCGCKPDLEKAIKRNELFIGEYTACGADATVTSGPDVETCIQARAKARGEKLVALGTTSASGAISIGGTFTGPCGPLRRRLTQAHEQIHSVHTGELRQQHGAGTSAFTKAFTDKADWVADEIKSRNTSTSMAAWALKVLERTCP